MFNTCRLFYICSKSGFLCIFFRIGTPTLIVIYSQKIKFLIIFWKMHLPLSVHAWDDTDTQPFIVPLLALGIFEAGEARRPHADADYHHSCRFSSTITRLERLPSNSPTPPTDCCRVDEPPSSQVRNIEHRISFIIWVINPSWINIIMKTQYYSGGQFNIWGTCQFDQFLVVCT